MSCYEECGVVVRCNNNDYEEVDPVEPAEDSQEIYMNMAKTANVHAGTSLRPEAKEDKYYNSKPTLLSRKVNSSDTHYVYAVDTVLLDWGEDSRKHRYANPMSITGITGTPPGPRESSGYVPFDPAYVNTQAHSDSYGIEGVDDGGYLPIRNSTSSSRENSVNDDMCEEDEDGDDKDYVNLPNSENEDAIFPEATSGRDQQNKNMQSLAFPGVRPKDIVNRPPSVEELTTKRLCNSAINSSVNYKGKIPTPTPRFTKMKSVEDESQASRSKNSFASHVNQSNSKTDLHTDSTAAAANRDNPPEAEDMTIYVNAGPAPPTRAEFDLGFDPDEELAEVMYPQPKKQQKRTGKTKAKSQ